MFKSKSKIFRLILIIFIICVGAVSFYDDDFFMPKFDESRIAFYNEQRINFVGLILDEPDKRINHTKLTVAVTEIAVSERASKLAGGKVLVSVGLYPEYQYGDEISIFCQLKTPEQFEGFKYDRYLAKSDIYSQCSYPRVKLISQNNGDWLLTNIYNFKDKLKSTINSNLPEPQASLFSAIFLGSKRGVPQELSDKFSITGTSHLIAISGLHITIITAILMNIALACYLPRKKAFYLITFALILYLFIIGFPPSAVRASIMGWLAIFAMYLGRLNRSTNALLFAAAIMILINPKILRDDIGFQLSFSAVLGLIYLSPIFEKPFEKIPSIFGIKESFLMSACAQISTMPLIVLYFGRLSIIGPLVNVIVLPILPFLMMIGFAGLFLSLIFSAFSFYIFLPTWFLLSFVIKMVEWFSLVPFAALSFE